MGCGIRRLLLSLTFSGALRPGIRKRRRVFSRTLHTLCRSDRRTADRRPPAGKGGLCGGPVCHVRGYGHRTQQHEGREKGLEYLLRFPKIIPLSTTVEINGAYYDTRYSSGAPLQYHPAFRDDDRPQPYVEFTGVRISPASGFSIRTFGSTRIFRAIK